MWETRMRRSFVDVVIVLCVKGTDSECARVCTHQFVAHRQLLLKKLDFFL